MLNQLFVLLAMLTVFLYADTITEQEAINKLKSIGMSDNAINSLVNLDKEFKENYPSVAGNMEASDRFIAEFTAKAQNVVNSMSLDDQISYKNHIKNLNLTNF